MALKTMPIGKLIDLRQKVEAMLATKVAEQRRALESELSKLTRFGAGGSGAKFGKRGGARGAVAPKYRNPENPAETWAGRGLKPRWLAAALKTGKKVEDFSIAAVVKKSPAKKSGKAKKK
jgi:DNA-binding protein H-NS